MNILYAVTLCVSVIYADGDIRDAYVEQKNLDECMYNAKDILRKHNPGEFAALVIVAGCMMAPGRDANYETES